MNYNKIKHEGNTPQPTSAWGITIDGVNLDSTISGYRTLNASGRETVGYTLSQAGDLPGRDGTVIYSKSIEPRIITVTYELKAKDSETYHESYALLSQLLHSEGDVEIEFSDDPYTYLGQVTAKSTPEAGKLVQVSTFTITCQNPFRFQPEEEVSGVGSFDLGQMAGNHRTNPEIRVLVDVPTQKVIIRNVTTGKRIIFEHSFKAGDELNIRIYPRPMANINGTNAMTSLAYTISDFGEFKVRYGDRVAVEPSSCTLTIKMRGAAI